jgi:hypothetical protein
MAISRGIVALLAFLALLLMCSSRVVAADGEKRTAVEFGDAQVSSENNPAQPDIASLEKLIAAQQKQLDALRNQQRTEKGLGWEEVDEQEDEQGAAIVDPLSMQLQQTYPGIAQAKLLFIQRASVQGFRGVRRSRMVSNHPGRAKDTLVLSLVAHGREILFHDVPYGLVPGRASEMESGVRMTAIMSLPAEHPDIAADAVIADLSVSTGHVSSTGNDVHLALHLSDGTLVLRAVVLWVEPVDGVMTARVRVVEDHVIARAAVEEKEAALSHNFNFKSTEGKAVMNGMGAVTGLQLYQRRKFVSLFASYEDGCVRLFTANGTLRSVLHRAEVADFSSVVDMALTVEERNQRMAFVSEEGLSTMRVSQAHYKVDTYCSYLNMTQGAKASSVAFHPTRSHLVYVGTEDGWLVQTLQVKGTRVKPHCVSDVRQKVADEPLQLVSARGYLYVSTSTKLMVYNVSGAGRHMQPEFVLERSFEGAGGLLVDAQGSYAEDNFVLVAGGTELVAYRSYMYVSSKAKKDQGFRMPMFLIGMIVVAMYQIYKKKKGTRDHGPGNFPGLPAGLAGMGRGGTGDMDGMAVLNEYKRMQASKYSQGMRTAAQAYKGNTFREAEEKNLNL